jgi:hypothetical protein
VSQVRFDPDGRGVSASFGRSVYARWLFPFGQPVPTKPGSTEDEAPDFVHLGPVPFSVGIVQRNNKQKYVIRDLLTGKVRVEKQLGEREGLYNPSVTPDGKWLAGTPEWNDGDRTVQFRDTATLTVRFTLPVIDFGDRTSGRFTPDGRFALYTDSGGQACVIELATGGLLARLASDDIPSHGIVMCRDASRAVGVRNDGLFASFVLRPAAKSGPLTDSELATCWFDLLSFDPLVALKAVDRLAGR